VVLISNHLLRTSFKLSGVQKLFELVFHEPIGDNEQRSTEKQVCFEVYNTQEYSHIITKLYIQLAGNVVFKFCLSSKYRFQVA
jgi:hypothetical protein